MEINYNDKWRKLIIGILIIVAFIVVIYIYISTEKINNKNNKNKEWIKDNVELVKDSALGNNIYKIYKNKNVSIYNLKYQEIVNKKIDELKEKVQDKYLVIYNPYGTNELSFNIYFKNKEKFREINYEISTVLEKKIEFKKELAIKDDNIYQIIGLVPGVNNKIKIKIKDAEDNDQEINININLSDIEVEAQTKLETEKGKSKEELVEGLYAMLGNESDQDNYIALYDNEGIIRSYIPIINYRGNEILLNNDKIYYNIADNKIVEINNIGKVTKIFNMGKYKLHHDYAFDKDNKNILVLGTNTKKKTIEDCIIKINIETEEIEEVLNLENLFSEYVEKIKQAQEEKEKIKEIDWIHLNALEIKDDDAYLSSREMSSIIKIKNILKDATIEYILTNDKFFEKYEEENYLYKKDGEFIVHSGQNDIKIDSDNSNNKEYYIMTFNNNYGKSKSREFDYKKVGINNEEEFKGDKSYFYKYKVNEDTKTFKLETAIDIPYSGIGGSIQKKEDNTIINSAINGEFYEYDKEYKLIKKYKASINKYGIYRVYKYNFKNFWFK